MKPTIIITLTALLLGACQSTQYLPTTTQYTLNQTVDKELYISNHDQTNPKKVAFYYENLHNVVIDGKGQKLVFHGTILPFVVKNCSNLTLRNFSIDFVTPHLRQ